MASKISRNTKTFLESDLSKTTHHYCSWNHHPFFCKILSFIPLLERFRMIRVNRKWEAMLSGTKKWEEYKPLVWTKTTMRDRSGRTVKGKSESCFVIDQLAMQCIALVEKRSDNADESLSEDSDSDAIAVNILGQEINKKKTVIEMHIPNAACLECAASLSRFSHIREINMINASGKTLRCRNLDFDHLLALTLPKNLELRESLTLRKCMNVKFPADLSVGDFMYIDKCKNLTSHCSKLNKTGTLFNKLTVQSVRIGWCNDINVVAKNLYLKRFRKNKHIKIKFKEIYLYKCANALKVAEFLEITDEEIQNREFLPRENAKNIVIESCRKIEKISDTIVVKDRNGKTKPEFSLSSAILK